MSRRIVVLCAVLAGTLSSAARASVPAEPIVVPPDLQALEQKMLALQVNSERFSASLSIAEPPHVRGPIGGFEHIFGRASAAIATKALQTFALLTMVGEASIVPQAASIEAAFLGLPVKLRLIGTTLYTEEPFIAKLDGGRPWVVEQGKTLEQAADVGGPAGSAGPGSGFKSLVETISRARSVQEVGPATVDGQATRRFSVTIAYGRIAGHKTPTREQTRLLRKLLDPLARVELFVAEDGLPVRTRLVFGLRHGGGELITQADVLALNVPVVVEAPPAAETIGAAELERLLARRSKSHVVRARHRVRRRVVIVHRRRQTRPRKSK